MILAAARPYARVGHEPSLATLILKADHVYLYFVLIAASGAVYRFGAINTYLWYVAYVWTAARLSLELSQLTQSVLRNWQVFLWPALALASVAWSLAPAASFRGGLQLLMTTAIAIFIGSRFTIRQLLVAIVVLLSLASLASLALYAVRAPDFFADSGGFEGLFAHKNGLGLRMNVLIAASLVLLFTVRWKVSLIIALGLAVFLLIVSKSATSQILALATPPVLVGLLLVRGGPHVATSGLATAAIFAGAGAAALFVANGDVVTYVLDSFGKDATLTGRTWLWDQAFREIDKHPLIGGGYQAFWAHERSSEVLWIRHILQETLNGFHNVALEVWVDLGIPGLISLVGVLLCYAWRTFRFFVVAPGAEAAFPLLFLLILLVGGMVNNAFFGQHELTQVLLCAFFASAALPRRRALMSGHSYSHLKRHTHARVR